ncbi:MBL fold metallo-hydrolase [Ramlibacter sp.]|uniref:MBL fold metallo-hydrolase n=1 Tax=Ramlibacter sp. TaxID=1917967 RepID=UPI0025CCCBA8|nr:MBL fold metallo-hydrolase [Ramlibacter sp.]
MEECKFQNPPNPQAKPQCSGWDIWTRMLLEKKQGTVPSIDHLDVPTIEALKDRVKRYFVPLGVGARLRQFGVAADRIEELDWWDERQWGDVTVTAASAQHFSGRTPEIGEVLTVGRPRVNRKW